MSYKTNSLWHLSTVGGEGGRLVPSKVTRSYCKSRNPYKPNEWPWDKWAIRLDIEHIFICGVDCDRPGTYPLCKFLTLAASSCAVSSLQPPKSSPSLSMWATDLLSWRCTRTRRSTTTSGTGWWPRGTSRRPSSSWTRPTGRPGAPRRRVTRGWSCSASSMWVRRDPNN